MKNILITTLPFAKLGNLKNKFNKNRVKKNNFVIHYL